MEKKSSKLDEFLTGKKKPMHKKVSEGLHNFYVNVNNLILIRNLKTYFFFLKDPRSRKLFREYAPGTLFIIFACYMTIKMESKHDAIKRKIAYSKSFHEEKIIEENEALKNIIQDPTNKDFNRQIRDVQNKKK